MEVKNSVLHEGACKAQHLTYLGDASVGAESNIGAGTITCNYDGVAKHETKIGSRVFIGSDSALVAPIQTLETALTSRAPASIVTENVPADARLRQSPVAVRSISPAGPKPNAPK